MQSREEKNNMLLLYRRIVGHSRYEAIDSLSLEIYRSNCNKTKTIKYKVDIIYYLSF